MFHSFRLKSILIYAVECLLTVSIAVALAVATSALIRRDESRERALSRKMATEVALKQMRGISIGLVLPDETFLLSDSQVVLLSQMVTDNKVICFIEPSCEACIAECEAIATLSHKQQTRFLFISWADPQLMAQMKEKFELASAFLCDVDGRYMRSLAVGTFPFSLSVSRDMRITAVTAATMTKDELQILLNAQ